jgi:uncharacterized protein YecE (DUF72 family)
LSVPASGQDATVPVFVGTSGWQYGDWRHRFYEGVPQRRWFEHVTAAFRTVELNVSFYRLPERRTFAGWCRRSPDDEVIAVKASRYLTHVKRLRDPLEPVQRLMSRATGLEHKLGPVLLQLPPDLSVDVAALAATLDAFAAAGRPAVAVETRHQSWWTEDVRAVLAAHEAAHVWADRGGQPLGPLWRTAPWGYVRFHHGDADVAPNYRRETLGAWADRVATEFADGDVVYTYFNNDPRAAALDNAITFAEEIADRGLTATRTPAERPDSWS